MTENCSNCLSITGCEAPSGLQFSGSLQFDDLLLDETPCTLCTDYNCMHSISQLTNFTITINNINLNSTSIRCELCYSDYFLHYFLSSK